MMFDPTTKQPNGTLDRGERGPIQVYAEPNPENSDEYLVTDDGLFVFSVKKADVTFYPSEDMHLSSADEAKGDEFLDKAKRIVYNKLQVLYESNYAEMARPTIYVVWFSKTLRNWKALLSTSIPDGRYYEVTYNGDTFESYLDTYRKESNESITDEANI